MSVALTRGPLSGGFLNSSLGLTEPGRTGVQIFDYGRGYRRTGSEPPSKQLAYNGQTARGFVVQPLKYSAPIYAPDFNQALSKVLTGPWATLAKNRSWDKLVDYATGGGSELGTSIAEGRESYGMLRTRTDKTVKALEAIPKKVATIRRAYKTLRRGNFKKFLNILGVGPKRKHRSKVRAKVNETSSLWLEYSFGWKPMVTDIYKSVAIVCSPVDVPSRREYATSGVRFNNVETNAYATPDYQRQMSASGIVLVRQSTTMEIMDHNLVLMNKLGLLNPASIAWELVPFSFVADWLTGIGRVIASITDLAGIFTKDSCNTTYWRMKISGAYGRIENKLIVGWNYYQTDRVLGLAYPTATWPSLLNYGTSLTRALNSVSLLAQLFISR